ncbi:MAG: flagellar filament capping protein FliD [Polyangiales bacterium]
MASPITFSGLASGIDSSAVISAMTSAAKAPMNKLTAQKTTFTAQSKKLTDIKTKLQTLQTATKALNERNAAMGNKATSSDEKIMKVTSTGGAGIGASKVTVKELAQSQRNYSKAYTSNTELGAVGVGTLTIQTGTGDPIAIELTENDNLQGVATKINGSGAGVTAGIIKEADGYRLQITGRDTGKDKAITFGGDLAGAGALALEGTPQRLAQDAEVIVDDFVISSATNEVTNAVPGATLSLLTKGDASITLERNPDELKTKLGTFITAYNDVMKNLNSEFASVGSGVKASDSLGNDSTMRSLQATLRGALSNVTSNGSSQVTSLGSMGVTVARDGTLSLDESKFKKVVSSDYEGMATALAGLTNGTGLMSKISSAMDPFARTDGSIKNRIDSLSARSRRIDDQVASMQTRLDKYQTSLEAQYSALESTISRLQSQGTSLSSIISSF